MHGRALTAAMCSHAPSARSAALWRSFLGLTLRIGLRGFLAGFSGLGPSGPRSLGTRDNFAPYVKTAFCAACFDECLQV